MFYRFGPFWLDASRLDLLRDGKPLPAGRQALIVLMALLSRPGELVTKDEIMRAGWPSGVAEEGNIPVQIHHLRAVLDDQVKPHRWIATVPRRGYRFIGVITHAAARPQAWVAQES